MDNWKKTFQKKPAPDRHRIFKTIFEANLADVKNKKPTDISARMRAMFELWCDTIGQQDKQAIEALENFEKYLVDYCLVLSPEAEVIN